MPRTARRAPEGMIDHAFNHAVARLPRFENDDYAAFERVQDEALEKHSTRPLAYCVMPNHWHMPPWPRQDDELTDFLRWLTHTRTPCAGTRTTAPAARGATTKDDSNLRLARRRLAAVCSWRRLDATLPHAAAAHARRPENRSDCRAARAELFGIPGRFAHLEYRQPDADRRGGLGGLPTHEAAAELGHRGAGARASRHHAGAARGRRGRSLFASQHHHASAGWSGGQRPGAGMGVGDACADSLDLSIPLRDGRVSRARLARRDGHRRWARACTRVSQRGHVAERRLSTRRHDGSARRRIPAGPLLPGRRVYARCRLQRRPDAHAPGRAHRAANQVGRTKLLAEPGRRHAVSRQTPDHPIDNGARHGRCAVRRRHGAVADLRARHSARGAAGLWLAAGHAIGRRHRDEPVLGRQSAVSPRGADAAGRGRGVRRGDDCLRPVDVFSLVVGCAVRARGRRQYLRRHSRHRAAAHDPGCDARPRLSRRRHLHRHEQRNRRVRVRRRLTKLVAARRSAAEHDPHRGGRRRHDAAHRRRVAAIWPTLARLGRLNELAPPEPVEDAI